MILRGQIPKDQLLFESEIEMEAKRNRKTDKREPRRQFLSMKGISEG